VLAAENFGKHKAVSQIVAINALLVLDACNEWPAALQKFFLSWVPPFAEIMLWVAVALTVASGAIYLWRNRAIYMSEV
jgi:phosphatidylglycerophosphate synthase